MLTRLIPCSLSFVLLLLIGHFNSEVYAGKIDLENRATTTSSQQPSITTHLEQFARFSAEGNLINQGIERIPCIPTSPTDPLTCGPTKVQVFSLSEYGINSTNLSQVGNLLQIQFNVQICCQSPVLGTGSVTVFLVDPADLTNRIMLSTKLVPISSSTPVTALFNLSDFGPLPFNISPDFFIGLSGRVDVNSGGLSGSGSSLAILSNVVATPEPTTLSLLLSGLIGSGMIWRRRRKKEIHRDE